MTNQPIESPSDNEQTEVPTEMGPAEAPGDAAQDAAQDVAQDVAQIEASTDSSVDYPSFEVEEALPPIEKQLESVDRPNKQHTGQITQTALDHTAPLPELPSPHKKNGRILLITAGCLAVLLACCCSTTLFMYFIGGDWLLRQLGYLP